MIIDIRTLPAGAVVEADLCIVGGGAAGIALALSLDGKALDVAVLESGGRELDPATQALATGEQSGVPYFALDATRYRMLGGSTFRWGARAAPLKPIDYAPRSWVPDSGWPISPATLAPYLDRVFGLIGCHRPFDYDHDVWKAFEVAAPAFDPRVLRSAAFQFGKNLLLGEIYRETLQRSGNITVYLNANVLQIHSNAGGDHVQRLDVAALSGQRYTVRADDYVLACGGIENARLLLLSDSANPAGLCNEHDLVGRYFMEHPTVTAGSIVSDAWQRLHDIFSPGLVRGRLVEVGLALSPDLQEAEQCLSAVARTTLVVTRDSTQALRELLWNLRHRRLPHELTWYQRNAWLAQRFRTVLRDPLGIAANVLRHLAGRPKRFKADAVVLEVRTEQAPNRDSRVTLSDTRDAFGQRRAHLHWALTARDRRTIRVAADAFDSELRRLRLGELRMAPWLRSDDLVWPPDLVGAHHHMGTTRMSNDPRSGVVDADCRAHALDNLYIAGSSVFPTAGYVNPTATLLTLAIRLAEHLHARYRSRSRRARTCLRPARA